MPSWNCSYPYKTPGIQRLSRKGMQKSKWRVSPGRLWFAVARTHSFLIRPSPSAADLFSFRVHPSYSGKVFPGVAGEVSRGRIIVCIMKARLVLFERFSFHQARLPPPLLYTTFQLAFRCRVQSFLNLTPARFVCPLQIKATTVISLPVASGSRWTRASTRKMQLLQETRRTDHQTGDPAMMVDDALLSGLSGCVIAHIPAWQLMDSVYTPSF